MNTQSRRFINLRRQIPYRVSVLRTAASSNTSSCLSAVWLAPWQTRQSITRTSSFTSYPVPSTANVIKHACLGIGTQTIANQRSHMLLLDTLQLSILHWHYSSSSPLSPFSRGHSAISQVWESPGRQQGRLTSIALCRASRHLGIAPSIWR